MEGRAGSEGGLYAFKPEVRRTSHFVKPQRAHGVPPGWCILDEDWTVVLECNEKRAVTQLYPEELDSSVFTCHQRFGTCLEFYLMGVVADYGDAEQWLRGEEPSVMLEYINPMGPKR